jgi:hypothetical protein
VDRLTALRTLAVAATGVLLLAACNDHAKEAGRSVLGHVRLVGAGRVRSPPVRACLRRYRGLEITRSTRIAAREGLLGDSVTIADPRSPWLYGCDFATGWRKLCGGAVGEWRQRRLNDPRLDILCRDRSGRALGAAWVVPLSDARLIEVHERRQTEVYPVADGLPVRIWTRDGVTYARTTAVFDVTQRDGGGRILSREQVHAVVGG